MPNEDTRQRVAVYGIVRSDKEKLAHLLAVRFCLDSGYKPVEYVDRRFPHEGQPSEWSRLMDDIAKGQLYGVIMRWEVKDLFDYCEHYNTRLCVFDNPFGYVSGVATGRQVRIV